MVAAEFSKLKRKSKEKCEHYRKSYTAREIYMLETSRNMMVKFYF